MPTLAEASLSADERRLLDHFVELLESELGSALRGVWLYGSRARGERPNFDSDVDLLVIVEGERRPGEPTVDELLDRAGEELGLYAGYVSAHVGDLEWLAGRRAIDAFYIQEVDRDKVVLAGEPLDDVGRDTQGGAGAPPGLVRGDEIERAVAGLSVRPRSAEYMVNARDKLRSARLLLDNGMTSGVVSAGYMAMLNAARAALSEEDLFTRTQSGTWHRFHDAFVTAGRFDPDLHARAQASQKLREYDDYGRWLITEDEAAELVDLAERFVAAVEELLAD